MTRFLLCDWIIGSITDGNLTSHGGALSHIELI